jgi:hypothetical protein
MCVIAIVETEEQRPSPADVKAMWDQNPAGGGVAWREVESNTSTVKWRKGLDLEQMQGLNRDLPVPFVLHFRIPSSGSHDKELNHPFPLRDDVSVELSGSAPAVLFHNGTWREWKDRLWKTVQMNGLRLPDGQWNDSRAMAFLAHHHGPAVLELIDEKIVVFSVDSIKIYGSGWKYDADTMMFMSNDYWVRKVYKPVESPPSAPGNAMIHSSFYHGQVPASINGGGPPVVSPFVRAQDLFLQGKISKSKFKMIQSMLKKHHGKQAMVIEAQLIQWEKELEEDLTIPSTSIPVSRN